MQGSGHNSSPSSKVGGSALEREGYEIGHTSGVGRCENCAVEDGGDLRVHAIKDGQEVAHAHIRAHNNDKPYAAGLTVSPAHQRKGLANAMYVHVEKVTGKKMHPSDAQSDDAKALWAQPNRPFGKAKKLLKAMLVTLTAHAERIR